MHKRFAKSSKLLFIASLVSLLFFARLPETQKAFAAVTHQHKQGSAASGVDFSFDVSMDEYIGNGESSGCNIGTPTASYYQGTPYWGIAFLNKDRTDFVAVSDEVVPSTTLSYTFTKNFPVGTEIGGVTFLCSENPSISFDAWYGTQYTGNDIEKYDTKNPLALTVAPDSSAL